MTTNVRHSSLAKATEANGVTQTHASEGGRGCSSCASPPAYDAPVDSPETSEDGDIEIVQHLDRGAADVSVPVTSRTEVTLRTEDDSLKRSTSALKRSSTNTNTNSNAPPPMVGLRSQASCHVYEDRPTPTTSSFSMNRRTLAGSRPSEPMALKRVRWDLMSIKEDATFDTKERLPWRARLVRVTIKLATVVGQFWARRARIFVVFSSLYELWSMGIWLAFLTESGMAEMLRWVLIFDFVANTIFMVDVSLLFIEWIVDRYQQNQLESKGKKSKARSLAALREKSMKQLQRIVPKLILALLMYPVQLILDWMVVNKDYPYHMVPTVLAVRMSRVGWAAFDSVRFINRKELDVYVDIKIQGNVGSSRNSWQVVLKQFFMVLFWGHWVGCLSYSLRILSKSDFFQKYMKFDKSRGVQRSMDGLRDYFQKFDQEGQVTKYQVGTDFGSSYVVSLYRGFTWNFEDLLPERPEELLMELIVCAGLVAIKSYCIGSFFKFHSKREMETQLFNELMESVSSYMESCELPPSLKKTVIQHFTFQQEKRREVQTLQVLSSLPLEVQKSLKEQEYIPLVIERNAYLFSGLSDDFCMQVCLLLEPRFMQPAEPIFLEGDAPRELVFLETGSAAVSRYTQAGGAGKVTETLMRYVRSERKEDPTVLGEAAFLLEKAHLYSARIRAGLDAVILCMSKQLFDEKLVAPYPEQYDLLLRNMALAFLLDLKGDDVAAIGKEKLAEQEGEHFQSLQDEVRRHLVKRKESLNASFTFAASSGDGELVKTILAKRVDPNTSDYDFRSAMHLAASEGMTETLRLILSVKGDANFKDRWGSTPLQDALNNGFMGTAKLIRSFGGTLGLDDPSGLLCACASAGDTPKMQQLLDFKVDVNAGDYDMRTALHLAATEGRLTVVAFLVSHGANVNVKDRWNSTPLEDAIRNGFKTVAHHLRSHGGRVDGEFAANLLCDAASTGNLAQLQMLVENGVDANVGDYDMRTAVHLAAAEGQLLALNFLINVANANHSPLDRWEATPLEDALAGGHDMCVQLLLAEGATLGNGATQAEKEQVAKTKKEWFKDSGMNFFKSINSLRSQIASHTAQVQKGRARSDIFEWDAAVKFNKQMLNRQIGSLQELSLNALKLEEILKRLDDFGRRPTIQIMNLLQSSLDLAKECSFWSKYYSLTLSNKSFRTKTRDARVRVFDQVMLSSMNISPMLCDVVDKCTNAVLRRVDSLHGQRAFGPRLRCLCSTPRAMSQHKIKPVSPKKPKSIAGKSLPSESGDAASRSVVPSVSAISNISTALSGGASARKNKKRRYIAGMPPLSELIVEELLAALGWDSQGKNQDSGGDTLLKALESFGTDTSARLTELSRMLESMARDLLPSEHLLAAVQRGAFKEWMGEESTEVHKDASKAATNAYQWTPDQWKTSSIASLAGWCDNFSNTLLSGVKPSSCTVPPLDCHDWQTFSYQPILPHKVKIPRASSSGLPTPLASVRLQPLTDDPGEDHTIAEQDEYSFDVEVESRRRLVVTELVLVAISMLVLESWQKSKTGVQVMQEKNDKKPVEMQPWALRSSQGTSSQKADKNVPMDTFEQLAQIFSTAAAACVGPDAIPENHKKALLEEARVQQKDAKARLEEAKEAKDAKDKDSKIGGKSQQKKDANKKDEAEQKTLEAESEGVREICESDHIQIAKIFGHRGDLDPEELALLFDFSDDHAGDEKVGFGIVGRISHRRFILNLLRWILNHDERQKAVVEDAIQKTSIGAVMKNSQRDFSIAWMSRRSRSLSSGKMDTTPPPPPKLGRFDSNVSGMPPEEPCSHVELSSGQAVEIQWQELDVYRDLEKMQEQASEGAVSSENGFTNLARLGAASSKRMSEIEEARLKFRAKKQTTENNLDRTTKNTFGSSSMIFQQRSFRLVCLLKRLLTMCGHERQKQKQRQRIARRFRELDEDGEGVGVVEVAQLLGVAFHHTLGQDQELRAAHRIFELLEKDEIGELVTLHDFLSVLPQLENEVHEQERKKMRMHAHTGNNGQLMKALAWMVIPPDAWWLWYWDLIKLTAALYYMIEVPVFFCFISTDEMDNAQTMTRFICNVFFDIFMAVNTVLNFFRSFLHPTRGFVTHFQEIRINYMLNFFFVDVLACLPLDVLVTKEKMRGRDFICRPYAVARLPRLLHLRQLLFTDDLSLETASEKRRRMISAGFARTAWGLLKLVMAMAHFLTCMWWYLGSRYDAFDPEATSPVPNERSSWIYGYNPVPNEPPLGSEAGRTPFWWQYLIAYYWSVGRITQTVATVGEMFPGSVPELSWCCVLFLVGFAVSGYVDGILAGKVMSSDEGAIEMLATRRIVDDYLHTVELPDELADQIRSTAGASAAIQASRRTEDVARQLPHILKQKIARRAFVPSFAKSDAFKHCSSNFLVEIGTCCKVIQVGKGSLLASVGEPASRILVLYRGRIAYVDRGGNKFLETARSGEMIGDIEVLFDIKHEIGARAVDESKLICLQRSDFNATCARYPTDRVALQRGMIEFLEGEDSTTEDVQFDAEEVKSIAQSANSMTSGSTASSLHSLRRRAYVSELQRVREKTDAELNEARQTSICHFIDVAAAGNVKLCEEILSKNDVSVDECDYDQRTALHLAVCNGHLEVVNLLVEGYGASLQVKDRFGNMPLDDAVREKHVEVAQFLIDRSATFKRDADLAGLLCQAGFDNDMETLILLLKNVGVDPNAADYDGRTALHLGASCGHVAVTQLLAALPGININPKDRFGNTPLDDAIRHQHSEVRRFLQQKGGEMGDQQLGIQICTLGAANDVTRLRELAETGVPMSQGDYDARTGLHLAASDGKLESAAFLLNEANVGANPLDRFLCTPLDDAIRHERLAIEQLLREHGGLRGNDPEMAQDVEAFKLVQETERQKKGEEKIEREMKNTDVYIIEQGLLRFSKHANFEDDMNSHVNHAGVFRKLLIQILRQGALNSGEGDDKDDPKATEARESRAHLERLLDHALKGMEATALRLEQILDLELLPWVSNLTTSQARLVNLFLPNLTAAVNRLRDYMKSRAEFSKTVKKLWAENEKCYHCAPLGLLMQRVTDTHMDKIQAARLDAVASLWISQGPEKKKPKEPHTPKKGKGKGPGLSRQDSFCRQESMPVSDKARKLQKEQAKLGDKTRASSSTRFCSSAALRMVTYGNV